MIFKVKRGRMGGEGGKEMNLILKIAQIDHLLYSPAQSEACELHQQELFLKRFLKPKHRWVSKTPLATNANISKQNNELVK